MLFRQAIFVTWAFVVTCLCAGSSWALQDDTDEPADQNFRTNEFVYTGARAPAPPPAREIEDQSFTTSPFVYSGARGERPPAPIEPVDQWARSDTFLFNGSGVRIVDGQEITPGNWTALGEDSDPYRVCVHGAQGAYDEHGVSGSGSVADGGPRRFGMDLTLRTQTDVHYWFPPAPGQRRSRVGRVEVTFDAERAPSSGLAISELALFDGNDQIISTASRSLTDTQYIVTPADMVNSVSGQPVIEGGMPETDGGVSVTVSLRPRIGRRSALKTNKKAVNHVVIAKVCLDWVAAGGNP